MRATFGFARKANALLQERSCPCPRSPSPWPAHLLAVFVPVRPHREVDERRLALERQRSQLTFGPAQERPHIPPIPFTCPPIRGLGTCDTSPRARRPPSLRASGCSSCSPNGRMSLPRHARRQSAAAWSRITLDAGAVVSEVEGAVDDVALIGRERADHQYCLRPLRDVLLAQEPRRLRLFGLELLGQLRAHDAPVDGGAKVVDSNCARNRAPLPEPPGGRRSTLSIAMRSGQSVV
ncbi:hypothetical protein DFH06DRAFT_1224297 [Mycena polygramma]|nr:hypothetical protein DFH06DRAFT_1224297 [Mycena polygramma]